ncbi:MAG: hypothetical protein U1F36_19675 [Planctomycetota bacterium]
MHASLKRLTADLHTFDEQSGARKLAAVRELDRADLRSADEVHALHEALCFMRAYPESPALLTAVERALGRFERRKDLRRHAEELRDSGIAGTPIQYSFFHQMATWLAARYPEHLHLLWDELREPEQIEERLPIFALFAETIGLDELVIDTRDWIDRMRGSTSDATFLIERCAALGLRGPLAEKFFEDMDLEIEIAPLPGGPSRTHAKDQGAKVFFQTGPMRHARPELRVAADLKPLAIHDLSREDGQRYIDMARVAMVTRSRDLDAFAYGDPDDVRLIEWEDGLQFAAIGVIPERRLLLESVYAYLTLKNGVPIGYVLNSAFYGSADIAYNVFETYRGAEAAHIYSRVVATVRSMFGVDSFTVYPYQLGDHNEEGLKSGAWWFYQKLGYRPKDRAARALMNRELAAMRKRKTHRSSLATLRKLATQNVFLHLGEERDDVIGLLPNPFVGLAVTRELGRRFGARREEGEATMAAEVAALCGIADFDGWTAGERLAFRRWAPLIAVLPGVTEWSETERSALADVVRRKGGRREQDFVHAFDAHRKLRDALLRLGRREESRLD